MNNIIMGNNGTSYAIQKQLGSGSFGTVYQVADVRTNKIYACKIISKALLQKYNAEKMVRQEIKFQQTITHRNIVKVYNSFEDNHNIYIISEFCQLGPLKHPKIAYTETELFSIVNCLLGALDCLHSNEIIHRDLKLDNILQHEDGTYKLCDFGWATYIQNVEPVLCGTTEYMPPEVVTKQYHDYKVDSWSFGVLLYILTHTQYPFRGSTQMELIQQITYNEISVNQSINEDLQILILALLTKDKNQRPSIQQLYLSRWIKKQLRLNNVFNKYENEQLKNKIKQKGISIRTIDTRQLNYQSSAQVKKSLNDSQKNSLTQSSSTQMSSSTNPCSSPLLNRNNIDSIFNFKDIDNITNISQPKIY